MAALGWGVAGSATAADDIVIDSDNTDTRKVIDSEDVTSYYTDTTKDGVGFNSFKDFVVKSGKTVNLHHAPDTEHLVNLVHDSRIEIDGIVNSLVDNEVGGHLVFADPHGMLVGANGSINAGRLTLTTPTARFMDDVLDGGNFENSEARQDLIDGTLSASDIATGDDALIEVNGSINTTGSVTIQAGRVRVGPDEEGKGDGAIEAGTANAVEAISDAVNVSDIATGTAATVTNGRIEIVAESRQSIADDREGNPLAPGQADIPADEEFAVTVDGRLAVARSDTSVDPADADTRIALTGTDVRVGSDAEIDAQGSATFHADRTLAQAGDYIGGRVSITAEPNPDGPPDSIWNPQNLLYADANLDLHGDIRGFDVSASGRYIDVGVDGTITASHYDDTDIADGGISLAAEYERYSLWGIVEANAGIRVDGTLDAHALKLSAYAAAISGTGPDDAEFTTTGPGEEALDTFRGYLQTQISELFDFPSFGVPLVADADATIDIDANADLGATTTMEIASGAKREVTTDRMLGSFFTGVSMVRGELKGETRVHVADGARLNAGDDIGLTGISDNDLAIRAQVVNLVPATRFALALAHGDVDVDTNVTVDHGAWLGDADDRIGGLRLRAESIDNLAVTAKSYSLAGTGLSSAVALQFTDIDTTAALHADVVADDDVQVTARSLSDYNSTFTDAEVGLNSGAMLQIATELGVDYANEGTVDYASDPWGTAEGNLSELTSLTLDEVLTGIGLAIGTHLALKHIDAGVGLSASITDFDNATTARIGPDPDGDRAAPEITAGGDVTVYSERVMTDVRYASGAAVQEGIAAGNTSTAVAVGVAYTDFHNKADAIVGTDTVIDANRIGVEAVADMPWEMTWFEETDSAGDFLDKYMNICAGICNDLTTSYVASGASAEELSLTGNLNWWQLANEATAKIDEGAVITASAVSDPDSGWTTELPETPWPGPGDGLVADRLVLSWRDAIDVRAYARAEEVHLAGLFSLAPIIFGPAFGSSANPVGGSMNYIERDVGADAIVADDVQLNAEDGDIGVRARTDDFVIAVSPSAGAGGTSPFVGSVTAGLVDIRNHARATVASSAELIGQDVTVTADHRLNAWVITGALVASSEKNTVAISIASLLADADVIARIGDPATDDGDETALSRPGDEARHTVRADDLTVRARSYGDVSTIGAQVKMPGRINKLASTAKDKLDGRLTRAQKLYKGVRILGPFAPLVTNPSTVGAGSDGLTYANSLAGAAGVTIADIDTKAVLRNVRIGGRSGDPLNDVRVVARRELDHLTVAGAAGIGKVMATDTKFTSRNISTTLALDIHGGTTGALVEGTLIDATDRLDVIASRADGSFVAGVGAATTYGSGEVNFDGVASVSLHLDETTTSARVEDSTVATVEDEDEDGDGDMRVLAIDESEAITSNGAGTFGQTGSGIGLTIAYSRSDRTIEAQVLDNSDLDVDGDLHVRAKRATRTIAGAASVGSSKVVGGSASVAWIVSRDTVDAAIVDDSDDSSVSLKVDGLLAVETELDTDGIEFRESDAGLQGRGVFRYHGAPYAAAPFSDDEYDEDEDKFGAGFDPDEGMWDANPIDNFNLEHAPVSDVPSGAMDLSIAGGIQDGDKTSIGSSIAYNDIGNTVKARIENTWISGPPHGAPSRVSVRALDASSTNARAIGGGLSGGTAVPLSAAGNHVHNTLTAEMTEVTLLQGANVSDWQGEVIVAAADEGDLRAVGGALSAAGSTAVAPALAVNWNDSSRTARIGDSDIDATDVTVKAEANGKAWASAVGLAVAASSLGGDGGNAWLAGAGSVPINILDDTVTAKIDDGARVEAYDSVVVSAAAEQRALADAGSAALATDGTSFGGAAPINSVRTDVAAFIGDSDDDLTTVIAHGHGTQRVRTGELDGDTPEGFRAFKTLKEVEDPELEADYEDTRGVAVNATSLQSSSTRGGTASASVKMALGLGVTVNHLAGTTRAAIRKADINPPSVIDGHDDAHADQSVTVRASSQLWSADAAVIATGGKDNAVGGAVTLTRAARRTLAEVNDADIEAQGALDVHAKTRLGNSLLTIGLSGASKLSVAAQFGDIEQGATTEATVRNSSLTVGALDIDADARNSALITVPTVAVGGTAGVGGGIGFLHSGMRTEASLYGDNNDDIAIREGVSVTANTESTLDNYVVGIGFGLKTGVAGSIVYTEFANRTSAVLASHDDDDQGDDQRLTLGSEGNRIGALDVDATESVDLTLGAGAAGVGGTTGVGGAAAMAVGRSVTETSIADTDVYARSIAIDTERELRAETWAASLAGGYAGAIAGGASLIVLGSTEMGPLKPELDAGSDGSVGLINAAADGVGGGDGVGFDEELIDADTQADMSTSLSESDSPALGDTTEDDPDTDVGADGAFVRIADATLDSTRNISVNADTKVGTKARAGALSGAAGGAAGVGVASTALHNRTQVAITNGSELNAGTDVRIAATAGEFADQKALDVLVASGAGALNISFGGSFAVGENNQSATVDVLDSRILAGDADIAATTDQSADIQAWAGSGALLTGSVTKARLELKPEAVVTLAGTTTDADGDPEPWQVASLDVDATNTIDYNHAAYGNSLGGATFAGAYGAAEIAPTAEINLDHRDLAVEIPAWQRPFAGGIGLTAANVLGPLGDEHVASVVALGLAAGGHPESHTTLAFTAAVDVREGVVLDTRGGGMGGQGGDIAIRAFNSMAVDERIDSVVVSGIGGGLAKLNLTGSVDQSVKVADGAVLWAGRDLGIHTWADVAVTADGNARGVGGGALVKVAGTVDMDVTQDLSIDGGAVLAAFRDLTLDVGSRGTSSVTLETRAFTAALAGLASADATVVLDHDSTLEIGAGEESGTGGSARAGRDVNFTVDAGRVSADAHWETRSTAVFIPISKSGGDADVTTTNTLHINAPVEAGYLNQVRLTVDDDDIFVVTDGDITEAFADWTGMDPQAVLGTFNPYAEIDARMDASDDPNALAILERLRSQMPDEELGTVQLGGFAVSAGDIVIDYAGADSTFTSGSNGSLTANGAPAIDIDNQSERYLRIIDDIAILTGGGSSGTVEASGLTLPDPLTVTENDAGAAATDARIAISNSATSGAPGLFVEGGLKNALGTVRLLNAHGDLAQFGPIIARVIDIDVPEGTFAVDRSGGIYPGIDTAALYAASGYTTPDDDDKEELFAERFWTLHDRTVTHTTDCPGFWGLCDKAKHTDIEVEHESHGGDRSSGWRHGEELDNVPSTGESLLRAQWVGITADYIDINSDIVAGQNSAYSLNLGTDVRDQIEAHNAGSDAGQDLELEVEGPFGTPIGATYNASDNRIELDPVEVQSGPGGVYLNGKIYSTVADADITINNGIAAIDVENSTGIPIELDEITAGADGAAAVLKITDHFDTITDTDGNIKPRTTWYVNGSEFEDSLATRETRRYETYATYAHWETDDSGAMGALDALRDPDNGDLQRAAGDVDLYETASGTVIGTYRRWDADDNPWRSGDGSPIWEDELHWLGDFSQTEDSVQIMNTDSLPSAVRNSVDENDVVVQRQFSIKTSIYYNIHHEDAWDRDETFYTHNGRIDSATYEERLYKKADYTFGVSFEGGDSASVEIDSNASVIVDGDISSPAGPLSICAGGTCDVGTGEATAPDEDAGIYSGADGAGKLSALGITLEADADIGLAADPLHVDTVSGSTLDAVAHDGSIDLEGTGSGSLTLAGLHAVNGHVNVGEAGTLAQAADASGAVIRGQTIDLQAEAIGADGEAVTLAVTDDFGHVNAEAVTGIHLDAVEGDLPIGRIVTTGTGAGEGHVTLTASGQIQAAEGRETDFYAVVEDNEQLWHDLALTKESIDAARELDVTAFEETVEGSYGWYWQIQKLAVDENGNLAVDADGNLDAEARRHFQPFADANGVASVEAYLTSELERLDDLFDTAFEGTRPAFLESYDPDFTYTASDAVAEEVKVDRRVWTEDELAAPLPGDAAQAVTGSVLANTPQHIAATGDVTLSAGGDIGRVLPETTFTVDGEWVLPDDDARAAILTAGAGDITCEEVNGAACVDADTGTFDFQQGEAYTFTIQRRQALRVDAEGTLNATSDGNALIGDGDTVEGMTVGRIEAAGELRLLSAAAITSDDGLLVNAASGIWLTAAAGAIGTAADPITIAATGAVNDAVGSGGVYLEAGSDSGYGGTLTLGRVEATDDGTVGLSGGDANSRIEGLSTPVANLTGARLELDYTGTLGDATTAPTLAEGMLLTGTLDGDGTLTGLGTLATGDLAVTGDGDLRLDAPDGLAIAGALEVDGLADLRSPLAAIHLLADGMLDTGTLHATTLDFRQAAGSVIEVAGRADLDLGATLYLAGTLTAGSLDAYGGNLDQAVTGYIDIDNTALLDFAGDIDLAGDLSATTLTGVSGRFEQHAGSTIQVNDTRISTTGDLVVADLRAGGTTTDAIDLAAGGVIAVNGTAKPKPHLDAADGGIVLDAATDIATASAPLVLSATTLSAVAGGNAWLELLGDATITSVALGGGLELTGDGAVTIADLTTGTYADLTAEELTLTSANIGTYLTALGTTSTTLGTVTSGGAQTYTDGDGGTGTVEWTTLDAGGDIVVDVGGDVTGPDLNGTGTLSMSGAVVDLGTATTTGDQTLTASGALTATTLDTGGRLTASGDSVELDTVTAADADLEATNDLTVTDLTTDTSAELAGDTIDLADADIGTDLVALGATSTRLITIVSGGAQTYTDGAGDTGTVDWTTLTAGGDVTVDVGGDVTGTSLTGAENAVVRGAAIAIDTVDTAGHQIYRGASLTYGHIDAGTWSGANWGEGDITRVSNIDADVAGTLTGTRARATGRISFDAAAIDVDTVRAGAIAAEAHTIDANTLEAATDIELSALTDIIVFELAAGDDLGLEAGGTWTFETLRAGDDIDARTTGTTTGTRAEAGGTASFRVGYEPDGSLAAPADLALAELTAERARLHTTGALAVTDPQLGRGIELRADAPTLNSFASDGGTFEVDVANAAGGQLTEVDLTVTGADWVAFNRLYAQGGRITTDAGTVGIDRGWVSDELTLHTPRVDLLVKNDEPVWQGGYDVQLHASDERFWLVQGGRLTLTDAAILRYRRGHGGAIGAERDATMYTGMSAERLAEQQLSAQREGDADALESPDDTVYRTSDDPSPTDPHPDWRPAVKATFDCTLAFPSGAPDGLPGQWNHGGGGCGDLGRIRVGVGRI